MTVTTLRKKVHQYLDEADEDVLEVVYRLMKLYSPDNTQSLLTDEQKEELEKRANLYLEGRMKTSSWEDVRKRARKLCLN